ncbi:MAG: UDP-N-acetylmuramate dehydrogenase [Clostridium sp.]|uniref:UDP-N-acetylmuramate dehydrogenase n=1 Tax=Clostridium TaxID=1485 RepID=UPI002152CD94|nr:UDP-N-acetylmuramate dehydrogenase [Clostridium sp. LY3-2]MCR6513894.1 UDP-N-acetylmuramate dehydrogenase [Clostridium sp. LY3-2]
MNYKELFKDIYLENQIELNSNMSEHIYFKVGGPVDVLVVPNDFEQVVKTIEVCKENKIPYYVIGNGSNLLVKDGGMKGVVIKLTELNNISSEGEDITADCGVLLKDVSKLAVQNELTGFEFACGIPGSVGGAVFMNAGAYNGEISEVIKCAKVLTRDGEIKDLNKEELELGYRSSKVMKEGGIILRATFTLKKGEKETIQNRVDDLTEKRESKQPLEYPSAGSTFKRPEGYFAGKLIQDAGLKGYSIGGACVSNKHSGFVINKGGASAKDILDVIHHVQDEVMKQFGVKLDTEVRIIGEEEK